MEEREDGKSGEFRAFPLALIDMERTDIRTLSKVQILLYKTGSQDFRYHLCVSRKLTGDSFV